MAFHSAAETALIAAHVRQLLKRKGITLRHLAFLLAKVHQKRTGNQLYHQLRRLDLGQTRARRNLVTEIADYFGVGTGQLISSLPLQRLEPPVFRPGFEELNVSDEAYWELRKWQDALLGCRGYLAGTWWPKGVHRSALSPEEIAELVRRQWSLGSAPISSVRYVFNRAGIATIRLPGCDDPNCLASGFWRKLPFLVFSERALLLPAVVLRKLLAVELGYLVQTRRPGDFPPSSAAEAFARAFLLPDDVKALFVMRRRLYVTEWQALQRVYGVDSVMLADRIRDWHVFATDRSVAVMAAEMRKMDTSLEMQFSEEPIFNDLMLARALDRGATIPAKSFEVNADRAGSFFMASTVPA
jgi:hypothetical protein